MSGIVSSPFQTGFKNPLFNALSQFRFEGQEKPFIGKESLWYIETLNLSSY
jgi:hypothetical protein